MNLHMVDRATHARMSAEMAREHARDMTLAQRVGYLRAVRRLQPDTFTALRNMRQRTVHFVGFRGEEFHSAVRAFGPPDFVHVHWDARAVQEVAPGDRVVFTNAAMAHGFIPWTFDDSNQPGDPAAQERLELAKEAAR
jgi:hypothetical protein